MARSMNNAEDKNRTRSGIGSDKDKDKGRNKESQRTERDFNQDSSIFHNFMPKDTFTVHLGKSKITLTTSLYSNW
jgi:hypothetical protein